ncbi:post-GPI attachment to proteins factor 6-like [Dendronephthya gigantea]|uniref:post-GPI attachment to proteins factor 6-like n=1 Tax=Dendronephthya gigantea TaxID=151771 RepID=UPI00106910F9|nr:post-GPI attachment to proteins factor 6-like [Dendronephthya gigantea]
MRLKFSYLGKYSHSKKLCSKNISILIQYGSPAIPHRNKIQTDSWLYNNIDHYSTSVSLNQPFQEKNFSSPLPGKWYVTAFVLPVDKVKSIKEKGLSKSDDKCLSAVSFTQEIVSPLRPAVVLSKGQPWKTTNTKFFSIRYYKYFVTSYSKKLSVQINCSSSQGYLRLALSATSLPTVSSPSNSTTASSTTCGIIITWPKPQSYYYIEVSGTCNKYELTANHEECLLNTSECENIVPLSILVRRRLSVRLPNFLLVLNDTGTFSFKVEPDYVGSILTFVLWPLFQERQRTTRRVCISRDVLPFGVSKSREFFKKHCNETSDGVLRVNIVYPQSGTWYINVIIISHDLSPKPFFGFDVKTETCLSKCNNHGSCVVDSDIGVSYGVCVCDYGYSGFACSDYHGLDLLAVYLLTISNIAFIPGIVVACFRKFYPEAIVYLFNMYASTVYHACDSHGYCIYDYNTLQLSDFFASVLSVWFTLVTMVKLRPLWQRTLNILAVLCLFIGVQLARFGFLIVAIPGGMGLMIVLISFGCRCHKRKKCFPGRKRWLFFFLPALILASVAVGIYTGLETTANYKYLHSIWHIAIASCIPLLLPTSRKPKFYKDYYQVNADDDFRDSDESLLLNVRSTADDQESQENPEIDGVPFPQLIN